MKIVWIMSRPLLSTLGSAKQNHTGSWIDAAFDDIKNIKGVEIHAIYFSRDGKIVEETDGNHHFYKLPKKIYCNENNIAVWMPLKQKLSADIMMVWGSEQGIGLIPMKVFSDIPRVVYIQGFLDNIVVNFYGGLSTTELLKSFCVEDLFRLKWIPILKKRYQKRSVIEKNVLKLSTAAILENSWCEGQIRTLIPNCKIYKSLLPIKKEFFNYDWQIINIDRHTVFTNAGGLPLKGHHTLFKAMKYVVEKYPDAKLLIPGNPIDCNTFKKRIKTLGYHRYLFSLIKKYGLQKNIKYLGVLPNFDDMANQITKCNAFVMTSYVENHSSSLIEAMIVGAPCAASYVGGVQNITVNESNALVHNPSDAIALADNICRIFADDSLALRLSENAKKIREKRNVNIGLDLLQIYNDVVSG